MQYVEEWYQQQQKQGMNVTQKRVYLATDDPNLLEEATRKYVLLPYSFTRYLPKWPKRLSLGFQD